MNNPTYIFNAGGKKYRVQDRDLDAFARELPNATIERNGETFRAEDFARGDGIHTTRGLVRLPGMGGDNMFPNRIPDTRGVLRESREDMAEANRAIRSGEARPTFMPGVFERNGGYVTSMGSAGSGREAVYDAGRGRYVEEVGRLRPQAAEFLEKPVAEVGFKDIEELLNKEDFNDFLFADELDRNIQEQRSSLEHAMETAPKKDFTDLSEGEALALTQYQKNGDIDRANELTTDGYSTYKAASYFLNQARLTAEAGRNNSGALEGLGNSLFDSRTWNPGGAAGDVNELMAAINKYENGLELSPLEQALLDAAAIKAATEAYYSDKLSGWYKAGEVTGVTVPYMLEFALTGGMSSVGTAAKSGISSLAKWAAKRLPNMLVKGAEKVATRIVPPLARGAAQTATVGLPRVMADAGNRAVGDIKPGMEYEGRENVPGFTQALGDAALASFIDNTIEITGVGPLGRVAGKVIGAPVRGLGRVAYKLTPKVGKRIADRVMTRVSDIADTRWAQNFGNFIEKTQWHGTANEFAEEMVAGTLNSLAVGDQTLGKVWSADNMFDTFLGVALMGGTISGVNTIGTIATGSYKVGARERLNLTRFADEADVVFDQNGHLLEWRDLRNSLSFGNMDDVKRIVKDVYNSDSYSQEEKIALLKYAAARVELSAALGVKEGVDDGKDILLNLLSDEYRGGLADGSPEGAIAADNELTTAEGRLRQFYNIAPDESVETFISGYELDEEGQALYNNYRLAKARFEGESDAVNAVIEEDYKRSDDAIDARSNNGNVFSTTFDGEDVFITGGDVVLNEDGTIDYDKSSDILYILQPDGTKKQIPADRFNDKVVVGNAEELKTEGRAKIDERWRAEIEAVEAGAQTENGAPTGDNVAPVELPEVPDFFRLGGKNYSVASRNADGSVDVMVDGKRETLPAGTDYSSILPTDKKGDISFTDMPVERTHEYFVQRVTNDRKRAEMIENNRKKAEAERKRFDKEPDAGLDPDKWEEVQQKWEEGKKAAQAKVDYWNEVAKREEDITRSRMKESYESVQPSEVVEMTPDEFIANHLPKITPESFKRETGLSNVEQQKLVGFISNEGVTVEQAAESILENYDSELRGLGFTGDVQDVRNMIIDVLGGGNPRSYAKSGLEQRKAENVDQQRAQMESIAVQLGFKTIDDMVAYEESVLPRIVAEHRDFDETEYYNNLAENYENDTTRESESIGRGGEVLQDEQPVPAGGTPVVGQRREGGAVSDDVQGGGQNGVAQEEVPVNKPVGNSEQLSSSSEIPNNPTISQESEQVSDQDNAPYTIAPAQYTTKKGKVLDMHLVKFAGTLTKEQQRAAKELAKAEKGWYDREQGGFMMRSEESAKQLADTILNNDDAVSDAQPVSLADTRKIVKPQQVNVERLINELNEKGEAKLSDHVKQPTNPSGNRLVTDERYAELRERMRKKLKGQMNIGIDPEILAIGTEMAVYHIEKGARKFADFAIGMIDDLGDAIRPYLKAFYNGARELPEIEEAGLIKDMTPYEEVKIFDVANFDKPTVDAMATAETVTREAEVAKDVETVKAPKKNESAEGKKLRKASQEDLEGNPVVYYKGEKHRILMLIHRGEQTSGARFTKPEITRVYLENMQDVKVDDLYVEDARENVGESGNNSVPSQQTPVNNLNENNDGREEITAADNSGAQLGRKELSDTEQVGAGVPIQDTARNSKSKRRNAGVGSSELGNGPQYDVNRNYTNEEIEEIVSSVTDLVDGKVVITGEVTDDIKAIVRGYESGGIAKKGRGILDEYYTDGKIVDAVNLLIAPYFNSSTPIRVLEPSVGIGNFIQAVNNIPTSEVVAFEINETTARIAKILYPDVDVNLRSFETEFIDESGNKRPMPQKYSLVIGNPPYGSHRGLYKGLGEESKIARYEDYFVKRSLDVLDEGGVLAMVLPSSWMDRHTKFGGYTIERAYRLPSGAFEATQVGTDIAILKKDSFVPVTEHVPYFELFPERVLGEVKQRKGRYGRLEEYVEGDIDTAIEAIKKEKAEQVADLLGIEKNNDALNDIESAVDETGSPEKAVAIVKDAKNSEKTDKKTATKQGKYKVKLNRGVETVPTSAQFTHEFSDGEVEAFADTDYEGALSNPAKHRRYANYIGGQAIHDFYYAEGDIYSKLAQLEQEKDYIVENYGVEQHEKQKALLESVLPKQKSLEEITISPNTTFVKNLNILTEGGRVSLKDMFVEFCRKLPYQAFGNSSAWEVIGYVNNEQVHGTDKNRNQRIRERRKRTANDLFNKFLNEELSDNAKKQVVASFNREYNSTYRPDYSKVPMFSTINRDFKGKPLKLTSVQLAGIGRMTVKGVGVLAHEVGFGKTLSGILAMHEAMTRGFAKKPVIVVPNDNILKQWVETIGEVLPNATVNTLGNLGAGYDLTDFKVNDGEFTIITYEGLKAMAFSDFTYNHLASKFSYITEDLNKHQSERDIQKSIEKKNELKGKMKRGTKSSYMFEDFGFDWLTVDEVHNANHIVSKVRLDKSVASDFRSQSQRTSDLGLKTWLAAQYIQEENNGRNVLLLSATPFTNKPLEYYSILSLVGNDMLERKGFFNVDQFFATFMEADNELEIGANGRPVQKTNVRRFRNNGLFQQLLSEFIDIKGEEDNPELVRPERLNKEYKIAQNELTAEAMAAAQELLSDNDTVLQGIGHARAAAFSPYATSLLGIQPKNHKEFVKNSPKIDATIKMVEQNIKDRPDTGQIIYSEVGVEYFPLIRDYLVKESGLKPSEVRIITGATSNNERVNIQTAFNNGEVKVVIGSPAIKEGLNLQGNTTDMYILSLPWNFTQLRQIEGRGWRQGNRWENIRINYMLTNDSVDVFMLQRLQLKQGLYNEAMKSGAESLDVSDIDTAELKTALITDPAVRAEIVTVQEREKLQLEKTQIEADLSFVMRKYEAYNKLVEKLGSQKNTIKMYREWAKKGDEYWTQRIPREEAQLANIENEIEEEKQSLLKKGVNVDDIVRQTEQAQNAIVAIQEKIDNLKEFQEELTQKFREESEAKAKEQGDLVSTYIKERKAENKGGFYKIRPVETETKAAEENTEDDVLYRSSEDIEAEYPNWLEGTTTDSGKHSTQVEGTRKTYKKVADWIEENIGKDVTILDASSGMGYGTEDLRERGFNIEDVEPYQSEDRKQNNPATYSSYADIEKQYDYIISNAVLNVIPDNWRTDLLHEMVDKLKVGGKLFINTRKAGEERSIKDKIELDSPQEVLVKRNGKIVSYQRFFTPQELKEWIESELGDGYTVEIANKANSGTNGLAAVVVTKNEQEVEFDREGDGPLTDREVVMESDVYSKVLGKPRYYGQKQRDYVARQRAKMAQKATELAEKLNTPIEVRETAEGLTGKKAKAKGWYDVKSGNIVVVVSNHGSIEDIQATVLHEVVAHKGLRQMFGEHFDAFLDNVYNNVDAEIRAEIDALTEKYGNTREATEEYLASLVENTYFEKVNPSLWSRIKQWFLNMLTEAGIKLDFELSDNELRYILWRSHQRLVNPGIYNPVTRITDVAVRARLGIGEYTPAVEEMSHVAEEDAAEYDNKNHDIFVSNAQRAVEGIQQNKATAEQWIAMLKKNGGLKAGEEAWLGLEEWLNEKQGAVTKQEILDFIAQNRIKIEEVNYTQFGYGLMDEATRKLEAELKEIGWDAMVEKYPGFDELFEVYNGELLWSEERASVGEYEDFIIDNKIVDLDSQSNAINETREKYTTEGLERKREIALTVPTIEPYNASDEVHFGDAGEGRAVAWVRFGETTDSEGNRVLVIDEIQSKRHQEGREKGYRGVGLAKEVLAAEEEVRKTNRELTAYREPLKEKYNFKELGGSMSERLKNFDAMLSEEERITMDALGQARNEAEKRLQELREQEKGIPSAPFEKNWHELAMKRMLRLAAEEGFDKVAWTTGEQQAQRYNIGAVVNRIESNDTVDYDSRLGVYLVKQVVLFTRDGNDITLRLTPEGIVRASSQYNGHHISDIVGKELGNRIMTETDLVLKEQDLRIGGEGMKGFYDRMLPSFVQKYTKKWGAKVGEVTMPSLEENNTMWSVDVTPEMQESVMQGQTMFRMVAYDKAVQIADNFANTHKGATKRVVISKGKEALEQQMRDAGFTDYSIEVALKNYEGEENPTDGAYYVSSDGIVIYDAEDLNATLWHENAHRAIKKMFGDDLSELQRVYNELPDGVKEDIANKLKAKSYSEEDFPEEAVCYFVEEAYKNGLLNNGYSLAYIVEQVNLEMKDFANFAQELINYIDYGRKGIEREGSQFAGKFHIGQQLPERNGESYENGRGADATEGATEPYSDGRESTRFRTTEEVIDRQENNEADIARFDVSSLGERLNIPVRVAEAVPENRRNRKGWLDNGVVTVALQNVASAEEAAQTVIHVAVGHKGLSGVLGERFNELLDGVYKGALPKVKRAINDRFFEAIRNGRAITIREATERVIADSEVPGVKELLRGVVRDVTGVELPDGELRYLLWKNVHRGADGVVETILDRAKEAETGTGDVRFRKAESVTDAYNRGVKGFKNSLKEGWYDEMRSIKVAQEAIENELGRELLDSENVYLYANHLPSINKNKKEVFDNKYLKPFIALLNELYKVKGAQIDQKTLERYANAKHGIERNREMAVKRAMTEVQDGKRVFNEKAYEDWSKERDEIRKKALPWGEEQRELDRVAGQFGARIKDYSGLTAIFDPEGNMKYSQIAQMAYGFVVDVEFAAKEKINEFWKLINGMTRYSLNEAFDSGLMSEKVFKHIGEMYRYYVPLRGFTEQTAEDFFDYVEGDHSPLNAVVKTAQGRTSEAENIFATILNMANSAIVQGSKNRLKQRLLNLALRGKTDLLSVDNAWYKKEGDEYFPVQSYPDDAKGYAEFERRMKEAEKNGEVTRHRPGLNIGVKVAEKWNEKQHAVRVKRNGKEYVIWVNGEPKLANAVNGLLRENFDNTWVGNINRFRAKMVTQYSPTFVFTNLLRDVQSASMIYAIRRGSAALGRFEGNVFKNLPKMMSLYKKHKAGTLDVNVPVERYFKEFLENGGETGYTEMITIEEYDKRIKKLTKDLNIMNATGRGLNAVGEMVDFANRCVENLCRFSAYQTSREMGVSILKSIEDAKEVSVNFNRKGSGAMGQKWAKAFYMFLNPAVQSMAQRILLTKKYPKKMAAVWAGEFIMGAAMPTLHMIISAAIGDEDELEGNYFNLSDYRRRSNICIPVIDGVLHIPLSHEARVAYGLGELITSTIMGHEEFDNFALQAFNVISQALPLNPMEGWKPGDNILESLAYNLAPDAIKPIVEAGFNRDFAGNRIHNRSDFNEHLPEYMRGKRGTAGIYKVISELLSGREIYGKSWADELLGSVVNPSVMEHLVRGYLGGAYTFADNLFKTGAWVAGYEEFAEFRNVPIASLFYTSLAKYEDNPEGSRTRRDWEDAFRFYSEEVSYYNNKEKAAKAGEKYGEESGALTLEQMERNGELVMIDIFNDGNDRLKELYGLSDAARRNGDFDRVNELSNEIYAEKRNIVSLMEQLADNPVVGYTFKRNKIEGPYGERETYGDVRDANIINDMQAELEPVYEEHRDDWQGYEREFDLWDALDECEDEIGKLKRTMKNYPEEADECMTEIRELRAEAIGLINNYRNNE